MAVLGSLGLHGSCDTTGKQHVAVLGSLGLHERQHGAAGTMRVVQLVLVDFGVRSPGVGLDI